MDNPRPEKVAVVAEVRERLSESSAAVLTEYRGLNVPAMAELRTALREAGGDYKIYKNNLVRFAAQELGLELDELLVGPTAIAFVGERPDGTAGDAASLAKALRDFAKTNDSLVIKGGLLDDELMSVDQIKALADLPSRVEMLSEFAGAMEYMFQDFAGLLENKLREFSYAMQELIDKGTLAPGEAPAATEEPAAEEPAAAEAPAEEAPAEEAAPAEAAPETEASADASAEEEAPAEEQAAAADETEAVADEAAAEAPASEDAGDESTDTEES